MMKAERPAAGDTETSASKQNDAAPTVAKRNLSPAAERALAEAAERRAQQAATQAEGQSAEHGGRAGPDPVRYGDWENGGIASDF